MDQFWVGPAPFVERLFGIIEEQQRAIGSLRTALAPLLMAACRFLLYLVAASTAQRGATEPALWRAGALAAYITGISYLARGESAPVAVKAWPVTLLFVPSLLALAGPG